MGNRRAPETSTKTIFPPKLATEQRTLSKQQEGDKNWDDTDTREYSNNQQGQHASGNDSDNNALYSSSNSGSRRALSVTIMHELQYNNQ